MTESLARWEVIMFYVMFASYSVSTLFYWIWLLVRKNVIGYLATAVTLIGFAANTVAIILRWVIAQRPPLTNGYEFILTFCWGIIIVYLFAEFRHKIRALGSFVLPITLVLLAFIILTMGPSERVASAIPPALKSKWLTYHVLTAVLAYGAFAVAFGLGIMYLLKSSSRGQESNSKIIARFPHENLLDELAYKVIGIGFPMLTLCIVTGAIWANYAWGTYWSWDPKETWSLITWIVYAAYLHARLMYDWKGKRAAWMAILGFFVVLFTFFGVNYLLPGLHSYA